MTAPLEFDGAPNWHCMGVPYKVLTHGGIKHECEPVPGGLCETAEEALEKFSSRLVAFVTGAEQVAWRRRPSLEMEDGRYKVTARLARFPEETE